MYHPPSISFRHITKCHIGEFYTVEGWLGPVLVRESNSVLEPLWGSWSSLRARPVWLGDVQLPFVTLAFLDRRPGPHRSRSPGRKALLAPPLDRRRRKGARRVRLRDVTVQSLPDETSDLVTPRLALRAALGGFLMGVANLVPGISGGTMLLAAGVYPRFIQAIADITTLRFRRASMVVLVTVVIAASLSIVGLAGVVKDFVVEQRWIAYSLFVGLTLGGVPIVWRLIRVRNAAVFGAAGIGFAAMAVLAMAQSAGPSSEANATGGWGLMFLGGVAGASAMILPGISGGYLLLVMGLYVPILAGVAAVKDALRAADVSALMTPMLEVVIPVGLGVVLGVVIVSNAIKWLLARYEQPTLGVLLGLLLGAVVGLWPFQEGVAPEQGSTFKGEIMTPSALAELDPEDYPTRYFEPTLWQVLGALGYGLVGLVTTMAVARVGRSSSPS